MKTMCPSITWATQDSKACSRSALRFGVVWARTASGTTTVQYVGGVA
jgi:hypothetical protein